MKRNILRKIFMLATLVLTGLMVALGVLNKTIALNTAEPDIEALMTKISDVKLADQIIEFSANFIFAMLVMLVVILFLQRRQNYLDYMRITMTPDSKEVYTPQNYDMGLKLATLGSVSAAMYLLTTAPLNYIYNAVAANLEIQGTLNALNANEAIETVMSMNMGLPSFVYVIAMISLVASLVYMADVLWGPFPFLHKDE